MKKLLMICLMTVSSSLLCVERVQGDVVPTGSEEVAEGLRSHWAIDGFKSVLRNERGDFYVFILKNRNGTEQQYTVEIPEKDVDVKVEDRGQVYAYYVIVTQGKNVVAQKLTIFVQRQSDINTNQDKAEKVRLQQATVRKMLAQQ